MEDLSEESSAINVAELGEPDSVDKIEIELSSRNRILPDLRQQTASLDSQSSDDKRTDTTTSSGLDDPQRIPAQITKETITTSRVEDHENISADPTDANKSAHTKRLSAEALKLGSTEEVLASANSLLQHHRIERLRQGSIEIDIPSDDTPTETEIREIYAETRNDPTPKYEQISFAASSEEPKPVFEGEPRKVGEETQSRDIQHCQTLSPTIFRAAVEISTEDQKTNLSYDVNISKSTLKGIETIEDSAINTIRPKVVRSLVAKEDSKEIPQPMWYSIFGDPAKVRNPKIGSSSYTRPVDVGSSRVPAPKSIVKAVRDSANESVHSQMLDWIENQGAENGGERSSGCSYVVGQSRTVIVHEIMREGWTWGSAWSPSGHRLAVATENHHLAIVDTQSSPVWRVKHDKRMSRPNKGGTESIRCVAWGSHFIAAGGTGVAVSILAPTEPYPVVHTMPAGNYVGSLDWRCKSKTLVAGNRDGKVMFFGIGSSDEDDSASASTEYSSGRRAIQSKILKTIDLKPAWINAVKFSPDGSFVAVGDEDGILGVYTFCERDGSQVDISNVANFKMENSILDIEWSSDGKWLYSGGEDFAVTIIRTDGWEAIHRIKREKWVQFLGCSSSGSHLAVGGLSSKVSILDVNAEWQTAISIDLKGMNPLSAKWHPKDQFLVVTGQNSNILAIETTKSRYVKGHSLHSISPILAVDFSPDGQMAVVGNREGIVTMFRVAGTAFSICYEMVLDCLGSLCIKWSPNGAFVAISSESKIVILSRRNHNGDAPLGSSGFAIAKVIRNVGNICGIAIDPRSQFMVVCGSAPSILDVTSDFTKVCDINSLKNMSLSLPSQSNFSSVLEMGSSSPLSLAASWSPDGNWMALVGRNQNLAFFDTSSESPSTWRRLFEVKTDQAGLALAWGPPTETGLQYCAYAGENRMVCIFEIRDSERSWERVLEIPRNGVVYDLDWDADGLLAAAISDGTVTVMDLSYLKCGLAVNEMDYDWQRQALTCFTEIQRNKGKNSMQTLRWVPKASGSDSFLAIGGTDGEIEVLDLTARDI